jgi:hypothetical protein
VDSTDPDTGGHLVADVEGLTIYYARRGDGYLIASSQGEDNRDHPLADTFAVYRRNANNEFVMSFTIAENTALGIDRVSNTDGVGATSASLGSAFPNGVFVAQNGSNSGENQNFKLVPWENIAAAVTPNLIIDTGWNPRDMPQDLTRDGIIDANDVAEFASQWLRTTQPADRNNDHAVDFHDLRTLCSECLETGLGLAVDFGDFAVLARKWRQDHLYLRADLNQDGRVDFADFSNLAQQWM